MQPPLGTQRKGKFEVFVSLLALHERAQLLGGGEDDFPTTRKGCMHLYGQTDTNFRTAKAWGSGEVTAAAPAFPTP